jgi:hypothetical protein
MGYQLRVGVDFPSLLNVSQDEAKRMEEEMHDAIEAILARRWHLLEEV